MHDFMDRQIISGWMDDQLESIKIGKCYNKKCRCMNGAFYKLAK